MFHEDMAALNAKAPSIEPRATEHIAEMIEMMDEMPMRPLAIATEAMSLPSMVAGTSSP